MNTAEIIKIGVCLFIAALWSSIGLLIRHYPETIAGYNTMPREKRDKIDIPRIGKLLSRCMLTGAVSMLLAPFMPSIALFNTLLFILPISILILAIIYINLFASKFRK